MTKILWQLGQDASSASFWELSRDRNRAFRPADEALLVLLEQPIEGLLLSDGEFAGLDTRVVHTEE